MTVVTPGNSVLIIIVGLVVYLLPSIVALSRRPRVPRFGLVVVINVLLGWTLVGWAVALAMALRSVRPFPRGG